MRSFVSPYLCVGCIAHVKPKFSQEYEIFNPLQIIIIVLNPLQLLDSLIRVVLDIIDLSSCTFEHSIHFNKEVNP